jgi:hypothetical protein
MSKPPVYAYVPEQPAPPLGKRLAQITRDGEPVLLLMVHEIARSRFNWKRALTQAEQDALGPVMAQGPALLEALAGVIDHARAFVDDWDQDCDREARADCNAALKRVAAAEELLNVLRPPVVDQTEGRDLDSLAAPAADCREGTDGADIIAR